MSPLLVQSVTHTWHTGTEVFPIVSHTLALFRGGTSGNHMIKEKNHTTDSARFVKMVGRKKNPKHYSTGSAVNFKGGKKNQSRNFPLMNYL